MYKRFIFCAIMVLTVASVGHALLPNTLEQEKFFTEGMLFNNLGSGIVIINDETDDKEALELATPEDKAIIGFYNILAKSACGSYYTLATDPSLQAVRDGLGPNHYMTLLAEAIASPNLAKRPAMFDEAIKAIANEIGEDSWEYALAHYQKANALYSIGNAKEAKTQVEKAIRHNIDNNRSDWWAQVHFLALDAVANLAVNKPEAMAEALENMSRALLNIPPDRVKIIGLTPYAWLSFIYQQGNDTDDAIDLGEKMLAWFEECGLKDSEGAAIVKHNYASALYEAGRYREAYNLMLEAQDSYKRLGMEKTQPASYLKKWIKLAKSKL